MQPGTTPAHHGGWRSVGVAILALAALAGALVVYHRKLLFGGSLDALDWQQHVHFYAWIRASLREHGTLPLYLPKPYQTWSHSLAALPESPVLHPLVWLLYVLSAQAYLKLQFVLFAALGGLGAYHLARALGAAPLIAALASAVFTLQGFPLAHFVVGHPWVLGVQLWPFAVLLFRRAVERRCDLGSAVGIAFVLALMILSGYHHPAIWLVALLGTWALAWALTERTLVPIRVLAIALPLALGLSAARVLPSAYGFAGFDPPERFTGIPVSAVARALTLGGPAFAAGYGYSGQLVPFSWERDAGLGILGAALVLAGLVRARRGPDKLLIGVAGLALLFAIDLGLGPWVIAGQRVPSRLLSIVAFCAWVAGVRGLAALDTHLWAVAPASLWHRLRAPAVLGLLVLVIAERHHETRPWQDFGAGDPVLTRPWSPVLPRVERGDAVVSLAAVTPNRVAWDAQADKPSQLLLPLNTSRRRLEWQIDGYAASIRGRNVLVEIPAGRHRVEARFVPTGFRAGVGLSLATLLASLALLVVRRRCAKALRPAAAPPPGEEEARDAAPATSPEHKSHSHGGR